MIDRGDAGFLVEIVFWLVFAAVIAFGGGAIVGCALVGFRLVAGLV